EDRGERAQSSSISGEWRLPVCSVSFEEAKRGEHCKDAEQPKRGYVLEVRADSYASIVDQRNDGRQQESCQEMRKINRIVSDAVQLDRVHLRQEVRSDPPDGDCFIGTNDQVSERHHPSGRKAH